MSYAVVVFTICKKKVPSSPFPTGLAVRDTRLYALLHTLAHQGPHYVLARAHHADPTDLALYTVAASRCNNLMVPSPEVSIAAAQHQLLDTHTDA
jgi:hypothetical protein